MAEYENVSEAVWQSARNLLDCQVNLDKLCEAFDKVECEDDDLIIEFGDEDPVQDCWVLPVWNRYYKVSQRPKGRKKCVGWITLAIQLTCDERVNGQWAHAHHAKVIAGYSASRNYDEAWEFETAAPNSAGICTDCTIMDHHWLYDGDNKSWFFAVPLDVVTSADNVEEYLARPLLRLIRGESFDYVLGGIKDKLCIPPKL